MLAIAGDGTLDAELRERARAAGVADRVRFLGNQTQDRVGEYFAAADVVVVPSVRDDSGNVDGLPNVVMEALASGTPLVTTAAGGIGAVVEDGEHRARRPRTGLRRRLRAALGRCSCDRDARPRDGRGGAGDWSSAISAGTGRRNGSRTPTSRALAFKSLG